MKYALWIYSVGAAATAVMLAWTLIVRTERVLGMVRKKVGPALESLREVLGERGLNILVAVVMVFTFVYQTLIWPHTMWKAITRKDDAATPS